MSKFGFMSSYLQYNSFKFFIITVNICLYKALYLISCCHTQITSHKYNNKRVEQNASFAKSSNNI